MSWTGFSYHGKNRKKKPKDARRRVIEKDGYGPNWYAQRARALKRDEYTCQHCGKKGIKKVNRAGRIYWTVHVHHKKKIKLFVNLRTKELDYRKANRLSNLITLCPRCHKIADGHAKGEFKGF